MKYIDAHAHLNFPEYDADREAVIAKLVAEDLTVVNVGTDLKTSQEVVYLTANPNFFATVGIHPNVKEEVSESDWQELKTLALNEKVVAIGECGLDSFRTDTTKPELAQNQKTLFKRQIELALEIDKPLMLHVRDAYDDTLETLGSYDGLRGDVHFFVGDIETARKFLDLGFYLSFTGVITFASEYEEVVRYVPLDRILSETDCPYATPAPYRGSRNEPSFVKEIVKAISRVKKEPLEKVCGQIWANSQTLFGLEI